MTTKQERIRDTQRTIDAQRIGHEYGPMIILATLGPVRVELKKITDVHWLITYSEGSEALINGNVLSSTEFATFYINQRH